MDQGRPAVQARQTSWTQAPFHDTTEDLAETCGRRKSKSRYDRRTDVLWRMSNR